MKTHIRTEKEWFELRKYFQSLIPENRIIWINYRPKYIYIEKKKDLEVYMEPFTIISYLFETLVDDCPYQDEVLK